MKWSFTGGLELHSVGFNLPFGNKRRASKKRLLIHQNMHNLQRKFNVLHLIIKNNHPEVERYISTAVPFRLQQKGAA